MNPDAPPIEWVDPDPVAVWPAAVKMLQDALERQHAVPPYRRTS